jgi:hypothetical protein
VQSIDEKVRKALECPCVADLKSGPCGGSFVDAFSCFLRSTEEEKVYFFLVCCNLLHIKLYCVYIRMIALNKWPMNQKFIICIFLLKP